VPPDVADRRREDRTSSLLQLHIERRSWLYRSILRRPARAAKSSNAFNTGSANQIRLRRFEFAAFRTPRSTSASSARKALGGAYVSEIKRHQWRYRHARALRGLWIGSAKVVNHLLWALALRGIIPHMSPAVNDSAACDILSLNRELDNEVVYTVSFGGPTRSSTL